MKSRWRKILLISLASIAVLAGTGVAAVWVTAGSYLKEVERLPDPFVSIPPSSRPSPASGGMTVLMMGLDTASKETSVGRADTMMVVRVTENREHAYVISIPRDSWVDIPGHGKGKINASYALGGPALAVRTVEKLTRLRIDHVATIDWTGFQRLTDAVGGVDITIPEDSYDPSQGVWFYQGTHRLSGEKALLYVRQRYGLPQGDLDRMRRQQNFLRALMSQLLDQNTVADPGKLSALLSAVTKSISLDNHFSGNDLWWLAMDAPKLRRGIKFLNAPVEKLDRIKDDHGVEQSIVQLNETGVNALFAAAARDEVEQYLATYGGDVLGESIR